MDDERESLGSVPTRFFRCAVCGLPHQLVDEERRCEFGAGPSGEVETPKSVHDSVRRSVAETGKQLLGDRYRVVEELGEGAFGVVYECFDTRLDRTVAVKLGPDPDAATISHQRFLREARMMAEVSSPGTVVIYDFGTLSSTGQAFISMERLRGLTLGERMERGPVELPEAMAITHDLLVTLDAFHRRGIIHRDLKPDNVFLHEPNPGERVVKVLDFGLARLADRSNAITDPMEILGTPMYMAPEVVLGDSVDARVDVFAVGSILLEMLTGRDPLPRRPGETLFGYVHRGAKAPRPRLGDLRPDLPVPLDLVVAQSVALAADDRHASAAELLRELVEATR